MKFSKSLMAVVAFCALSTFTTTTPALNRSLVTTLTKDNATEMPSAFIDRLVKTNLIFIKDTFFNDEYSDSLVLSINKNTNGKAFMKLLMSNITREFKDRDRTNLAALLANSIEINVAATTQKNLVCDSMRLLNFIDRD